MMPFQKIPFNCVTIKVKESLNYVNSLEVLTKKIY